MARQAGLGLVWHGQARHSMAGVGGARQARQGEAGPGTAWLGKARLIDNLPLDLSVPQDKTVVLSRSETVG